MEMLRFLFPNERNKKVRRGRRFQTHLDVMMMEDPSRPSSGEPPPPPPQRDRMEAD